MVLLFFQLLFIIQRKLEINTTYLCLYYYIFIILSLGEMEFVNMRFSETKFG